MDDRGLNEIMPANGLEIFISKEGKLDLELDLQTNTSEWMVNSMERLRIRKLLNQRSAVNTSLR